VRRVEGGKEKERQRVVEKAAGGTNASLYLARGSEWQMGAGSHTQTRRGAGGEAGHGAAKLDGVIHRYGVYGCQTRMQELPSVKS
jgi:hypothetical protein